MQLEGKAGLSIVEACDAAHLSRAGFYRHFDEHAPRQADTELRGQLNQICLDHRCYGSRRVTAELRARGRLVNRKRVVRLMRADILLCLRDRGQRPATPSRGGDGSRCSACAESNPTHHSDGQRLAPRAL